MKNRLRWLGRVLKREKSETRVVVIGGIYVEGKKKRRRPTKM